MLPKKAGQLPCIERLKKNYKKLSLWYSLNAALSTERLILSRISESLAQSYASKKME